MCKNLIKRSGSQSWYFRLAIPSDLQAVIGKTVIKRSLGTADKRKAERMAKSLTAQWKGKFKELRTSTAKSVNVAALEYELADHLDALQAEDKLRRAEPVGPMPDYLAQFRGVYGQSASAISATSKAVWISELQSSLVSNDFSAVHAEVESFMRQNGYAYLPGTIEYNQIARGIIETHIRLYTLTQRRDAGDVIGGDFVQTVSTPTGNAREPVSLEVEVHPVSELVPLFFEKKALGEAPIVQTTVDKYSDAFNEFVEIVGDVPIAEIDHGTIREFRDTLLKLPIHRNKKAELRGKSIPELLEMEGFETQSASTVNGKLSALRNLFDWAKDDGYVDENYVLGKELKGTSRSSAVYQRFSTQDLKNIFTDSRYLNDRHLKHWQFWVPILALYTGSRQSPIAALRCDELRQTDNGVWYVHINKDKTKAGKRDVPLHPFIVEDLNFPGFVEHQRSLGHETIFQIKPKGGKPGQRISRWWRETFIGSPEKRVELAPPDEGRSKVFHSFRSTLINAAKQHGADTDKIEETVGHADSMGKRKKSMSTGYYADDFLIETRYENVIKPVCFPVEAMEHLRQSKYVVR